MCRVSVLSVSCKQLTVASSFLASPFLAELQLTLETRQCPPSPSTLLLCPKLQSRLLPLVLPLPLPPVPLSSCQPRRRTSLTAERSPALPKAVERFPLFTRFFDMVKEGGERGREQK